MSPSPWWTDHGTGRVRISPGLVALPLVVLLVLGARPIRPDRSPAALTRLLAESPHAGECNQCHTMHGQGPIAYEHALLGPDDNSLCDHCHDTPWAGGSYAGRWLYVTSSHGANGAAVWPGPSPPPRTEAGAAGKCVNCHDPHGWDDGAGIVPQLGKAREEKLCLTCHDGSPAIHDINSDVRKAFRHPVTSSGRHAGPAESVPTDFGAAPENRRHSECVDCHNPHVVTHDAGGPPPAPELSRVNLGVSRVLVQNGGPGTSPSFTFVPGSDTLGTPFAEYQLCFKCHSSWTTQPSGQTDLALELNPANASYHPVEAAGTDPGIDPGSFTAGWSATSLTRCGDCHGSDFEGGARGPHGSFYRHILKRPYTASSAPRAMASDELCFGCHSFDVYGNPSAPELTRRRSRFNAPGAVQGHAEHTAAQVSCYACHATHGAPHQAHLIVTGRNPGIVSYDGQFGRATCTPTCHEQQTYTINYER